MSINVNNLEYDSSPSQQSKSVQQVQWVRWLLAGVVTKDQVTFPYLPCHDIWHK